MTQRALLLSGVIIAACVSGCIPKEPTVKESAPIVTPKPKWVFTPSSEGGLGGVGICATHIKGPSAQREVAISRAMDEIARQMGVKIQTALQTSAKVTNASVSTTLETYSVQTTDGRTIKATLRELWMDPASGELYAWMISK